jgi:hypothetical protein
LPGREPFGLAEPVVLANPDVLAEPVGLAFAFGLPHAVRLAHAVGLAEPERKRFAHNDLEPEHAAGLGFWKRWDDGARPNRERHADPVQSVRRQGPLGIGALVLAGLGLGLLWIARRRTA